MTEPATPTPTSPAPPAPPRVPLATAVNALDAARRYRAQWLLALADGAITTLDLLAQAATIEGRPLTRLRLRQVLAAQPGVGEITVRRRLDQIAAECDHPSRPGTPGLRTPGGYASMTVGWLLDNRARGARFAAWLAAVEVDRRTPAPWPGFPFTDGHGTRGAPQ